jgi:hypothetical protein
VRGGLTPKSFSVRDSCLDLSRQIAETPVREHHSSDGASRSLNPRYWRRHHQLGDHNKRGLLDGGPDEFSGYLHDKMTDRLTGVETNESPRAALNRQKLARVNARKKARQRDAFIQSFLAPGYAPRTR